MNHFPIFARAPDVQWPATFITAANTTVDLTSGTIYLAFEADADNGGWLSRLKFKPTPGGTTTATVARLWLNNGGDTSVAANNVLLEEVTLIAVAASGTAATFGFEHPLDLPMPAGYRLYITIHTASANGWAVVAIGGKY